MAFPCIFASLETDFLKTTIRMEALKYHLGLEHTPSGALLLKVIIVWAHEPMLPSFARLYPSWMPR
jgi:flagellar biosynthesis protein FliP